MGLPWTKNPPRACPPVKPDHHALVKAVDPAQNEVLLYIAIPIIHHLPNLPKFVNI